MKYVHYKYFNNDSINWKEEWILLEDESLEWILEFLKRNIKHLKLKKKIDTINQREHISCRNNTS